MTHARLADLWNQNLPAFGGWVTTGYERTIEAYMMAGFDYVGIDCQHSVLDEAAAAALIRRYSLGESAIVARTSENSAASIGKLLDAGADAVIVPGVNNSDEAASAVAACLYPPLGVRSYGAIRSGLGRSAEEIAGRAQCFVMIETEQGLENLTEICEVPGLAGIYVGPADLSIGLGMPVSGAFTSGQLDQAFAVIKAACSRNELLLGAHASDPQCAKRWIGKGCNFVSVGTDAGLISIGALSLIEQLTGSNPGMISTVGAYA